LAPSVGNNWQVCVVYYAKIYLKWYEQEPQLQELITPVTRLGVHLINIRLRWRLE
jgi:hypothetical protein